MFLRKGFYLKVFAGTQLLGKSVVVNGCNPSWDRVFYWQAIHSERLMRALD
jgi:hypothetical protein